MCSIQVHKIMTVYRIFYYIILSIHKAQNNSNSTKRQNTVLYGTIEKKNKTYSQWFIARFKDKNTIL